MCGIAMVHDLRPGAAHDWERHDAGRLIGEDMLSRLHHRGPDGSGTRQVGPTWLGHTRLSIVDLDGGEQPMRTLDGERWVVANGEIYNHEDLRTRLGGPSPPTPTPRWCCTSSIGTASRGSTTCAACTPSPRPPGRARSSWPATPWASSRSTGPATTTGCWPPPSSPPSRRGFGPTSRSSRPGTTGLPHGGLRPFVDLRVDPLGLEEPAAPVFTDREEARAAIRDTLVAGVGERMMADVPVGVFLSGGLDSSIVAAILARLAPSGTTVHSFAAGTEGSGDLLAARVVAAHLGLEHHERIYTDDDVIDALPEVVRATESYEPSLVRSAVPNFLLSELAARHLKVVLTGEGADELFAGYHHFRTLDVEALRAALADGIDALHHLNLQRCDRVTMAHGLEARVPFLSRDMLALAQRIPMEWKLLGDDGQEQAQEKALLREAFEGWLPEAILWRRKEQFGDGSGTAEVMARQAERLVPDEDWEQVVIPGLPRARSREELGYQRIFAEHLGGIRAEQVLGRFATA